MKDPGNVAQGRALTRLSQENRQKFRSIYANAPGDLASSSRRAWALKQLSLEYADRYREVYAEERESLVAATVQLSIDPDNVASASGPGPWHAVLAGASMTACGRTRIQIYTARPDRQVDCAYCIEERRERKQRESDPQFGVHAAAAEARIREFTDLQERTAAARIAMLDALSPLRTPPVGTGERERFAELLRGALDAGMTLREIGGQMGISGERVRQLTDIRSTTESSS